MRKVYIVEGDTGDYDSRMTWPVLAFFSEVKARALVDSLTRWCIDNKTSDSLGYAKREHEYNVVAALKCPQDPGFAYDGNTGTRYSYWMMDVEED